MRGHCSWAKWWKAKGRANQSVTPSWEIGRVVRGIKEKKSDSLKSIAVACLFRDRSRSSWSGSLNSRGILWRRYLCGGVSRIAVWVFSRASKSRLAPPLDSRSRRDAERIRAISVHVTRECGYFTSRGNDRARKIEKARFSAFAFPAYKVGSVNILENIQSLTNFRRKEFEAIYKNFR